jgi:hypothetical protein
MAASVGRSELAKVATVALVSKLFVVLAGSSAVAEAWIPEPDAGADGSVLLPPAADGPPAVGAVGPAAVPPPSV